MGNTQSMPEEAEDDSGCTVKTYQPLSESPEGVQNGSVVFARPAANGEVDAKAGAGRDKAAAECPEAQSGGRAASRALPVTAGPGRSEHPAAALDATRAPQERSHPNPGGRAPLQDPELTGTPEGQDAAAPAPTPVTLLDRIFRTPKGRGRTRGKDGQQVPDIPNGAPLGKEVDECSQQDLGQGSAGAQGPAAPARAEVEQDSAQAAAAQGSVMSFLKTLVSPSKAEAKSDSEDKDNEANKDSPAPAVVPKGSKAEKGPGGQPAPKAAAESPSRGAKKKKAESPKLGHGTFSKLFRHKAAKETQQTANTKSPEQPPVTSVKPDRNVPPATQEAPKQNPKAPEAAAPAQGVTGEGPREGSKDKGSATPLPLSKLFWKKNSSEEAEAVSNEKAEAAPEPVAPDRDESKSAEAAEVKPRGAESKTPKANLRKFFKLSVKGDGGPASSAEADGPSPSHHTLNATERPLAPTESDAGGQRSKESSKDKKSTAEQGRQKGREPPDPREQLAADSDSIQNGGDAAKEPPYKKTEKRQSLGGFFKGLGSKRMSDAEVQTDPVSILPAGKSK